ncbi:MAG TPA: hypothetical protein DCL39_15400 [Alteromonas macleodii]|nr:hypothetical protein [Alteromonas macleodii]OZB91985.1 hypothetical protein BBP29_08415 [Alteromonas macleodii]HAA98799.1 hypothetical protein [Alteromonas macleodii]HAG30845.1 hypothetical protein [Alteromonas macleodii]
MSLDWSNRQRITNRMVRRIAEYVFEQPSVTPRQLYGLSKLSWITNSYEGGKASYIKSTKIPALGDIFDRDFTSLSLKEVSQYIALTLKDESVANIVQEHTGFTNFYKAYRNSSLAWVEENFDTLLPMYKSAFAAKNDNDREMLIKAIQRIPGIPKANHQEQLMKAEYLLTPAFFMLDREIKFPLINGNEGVKQLLKALKVKGDDLLKQYRAMVSLYGTGGIEDAADLDQIGNDLPDFIETERTKPKKGLLQKKETKNKNTLPLKDEEDVEVIRKAGTIKQRKIHNQLTNMIRTVLSNYTLLEGRDNSCMFDVLVQKYNKKHDLIIEVKSSLEKPNIRMAVGQLLDYWYRLKGDEEPHIAILLPGEPDSECVKFLEWMDIGLMWFHDDELNTSTDWLNQLIIKS